MDKAFTGPGSGGAGRNAADRRGKSIPMIYVCSCEDK